MTSLRNAPLRQAVDLLDDVLPVIRDLAALGRELREEERDQSSLMEDLRNKLGWEAAYKIPLLEIALDALAGTLGSLGGGER